MTTTASRQHGFKVEYMQPFLDSLKHLFEGHLGDKLSVSKMRVNTDGRPAYEVSGVIAFSGTVIGRAVLSFPADVAEAVVKDYVKLDPLPPGVMEDCVGELTNVVVGRAKSSLEKFNIVISPPTVVRGTEYVIAPQRDSRCLSIPCRCSHGDIRLDISIVENSAMGAQL